MGEGSGGWDLHAALSQTALESNPEILRPAHINVFAEDLPPSTSSAFQGIGHTVCGQELTVLPLAVSQLSEAAWAAAFPKCSLSRLVMKLGRHLRRTSDYARSVSLADIGAAVLDSRRRVWLLGSWAGSQAQLSLLEFYNHAGLNRAVVQTIACGSSHMLLLSADGGVWTWGSSQFGALGHTGAACWSDPVRTNLRKAQSIACTQNASFAVVSGSLYSWGRTSEIGRRPVPARSGASLANPAPGGQQDTPANSHCCQPSPVEFPSPSAVASICCGLKHTLVLQGNGHVIAFGSNEFGQCGMGATATAIHYPRRVITKAKHTIIRGDGTANAATAIMVGASPQVVHDLDPQFSKIACGPRTSFAVSGDPKTPTVLWGWGWNKSWVLGSGNDLGSFWPQKLLDSQDLEQGVFIESMACDCLETVVHLSSGAIYCAGKSSPCVEDHEGRPLRARANMRFARVDPADPLFAGFTALGTSTSGTMVKKASLIIKCLTHASAFSSAGSISFAQFQRCKVKQQKQ